MTAEEITKYVLSFLGGGLVSAIGNWLHAARSARKQREIEYLTLQLQSLYGPLHFFTTQNERLFELARSFIAAHHSEIASKDWSSNEHTQASVRKDSDTTINLSNAYVKRAVENNARIMDILEKGWHLIDPGDIDEFASFQIDFTRLKTEQDELTTPYRIYRAVGDISYIRPEMIARVRERVRAKQTSLNELRRGMLKRIGYWLRRTIGDWE